jgi:gas vesicle protein
MTQKNDLVGPGLSLLGGAVAGAALMYLLDPERGEARRHGLASRAGEALSTLGETANESLHGMSGVAGSAWSSIASQAAALASAIGQHTSEAAASGMESASGAADTARSTMGGLADSAMSSAQDIYDSARNRFGFTPEPSMAAKVAGVATRPAVAMSATSAILLGAAAVYFLDPTHGARRRQATFDAVNSMVGSARQFVDRVMNRPSDNPDNPTAVQGEPMDYASSDQYINDEGPEVGRSTGESSTSAGTTL